MRSFLKRVALAAAVTLCFSASVVSAQEVSFARIEAQPSTVFSQCYHCVFEGELTGWKCEPVQAGQSTGPGYHTCIDNVEGCDMSAACSPQFAMTSGNVAADGGVKGTLAALGRRDSGGKRFVLGCEGKVIARTYSTDAGRRIRTSTARLVV